MNHLIPATHSPPPVEYAPLALAAVTADDTFAKA
jgi:hypothetical protein